MYAYPAECTMDNPKENCLRIDLNKNECVGDNSVDVPIAYSGASQADVGLALAQCIQGLSWTQINVYKLESIPDCDFDRDSKFGIQRCIRYAQLELMNSFTGVYTDVFV